MVLLTKFKEQLKSSPMVRDTVVTTIFATSGRGIGFLIPFFIAAWYGVGKETDAFFFAYSLIIYLATIFSPVMESIMVPFIAEKRANREDVGAFVGQVLGFSAIGLLLLSGIFMLVIKPILTVSTRFSPEGLELIYGLLLETIPLLVLLVWTSILAGTLNAYKVFVIPAISPAFRAIATLGFIYAFKEPMGVHAIAWGYVIGEIFRLVILFWLLQKLNFIRLRVCLTFSRNHPRVTGFSEFLKTSSYQLLGMSVAAFTPVINKTMASWLGKGSVSILEYADRLYMIPLTFLASGFMVTFLSHWSDRYQTSGEKQLQQDVRRAVYYGAGLSGILTVFLLLFNTPIVAAVYGYGEFPKNQIPVVALVFGFYLFSVPPYFLTQLYARAFLTRKDTKTLLLISAIKTAGTIGFNLLLIRSMGLAGIALATTIVTFITLGISSYLFHTRKST